MPRIKIENYEKYPLRTELKVRVGDLNYGAHLGYDRILTLAHQVRVEIFADLGVAETDLGDGRTGIVAADAAVVYRGEAFVNDVLVFETLPVEVGMVSFRLAHRVTQQASDKEVALVEIGFVAFDYERRAPSRLPATFTDALRELASR